MVVFKYVFKELVFHIAIQFYIRSLQRLMAFMYNHPAAADPVFNAARIMHITLTAAVV